MGSFAFKFQLSDNVTDDTDFVASLIRNERSGTQCREKVSVHSARYLEYNTMVSAVMACTTGVALIVQIAVRWIDDIPCNRRDKRKKREVKLGPIEQGGKSVLLSCSLMVRLSMLSVEGFDGLPTVLLDVVLYRGALADFDMICGPPCAVRQDIKDNEAMPDRERKEAVPIGLPGSTGIAHVGPRRNRPAWRYDRMLRAKPSSKQKILVGENPHRMQQANDSKPIPFTPVIWVGPANPTD
ncbi:hypothetical protein HOY80DRAFT_1005226 [Tuber brumale]|nr:hypothetical protein HOY80DRAFT_1005226 [Tuber brumale]